MHSPKKQKANVRVLDHAGVTISWVTAEKAAAMVAAGKACRRGTKRRIRAVQIAPVRPDTGRSEVATGSRARRPLGIAHRAETHDNPRGVFTIDRLPAGAAGLFVRDVFFQVVRDSMDKAA